MKSLNSSTSRALASLVLVATLVLALVGLPVRVKAQAIAFAKVTPGSTTPLSLVPAAPSGSGQRASLTVENVGSVNIGFSSSPTVTYATGVVLGPSQQLLCTGVTSTLYGIAQSSTADLRVTATYSQSSSNAIPQCSISRLSTTGGAINTAASTTVPMSDGAGNIVPGNVLIYLLTGAVTANSTTTATAAGTLAITSNATGLGTVFRSDGSKWQLLANYSDASVNGTLGTIATTSNTDEYIIAPFAGTLTGADFSAVDALTANDTNFITFTITNLGQAGSGSTAMLAATAPNTTQATGGTSIAANTKFVLTISGTGSALIVAKGDRLRVRAAATGTLANTVTFSRVRLYFTRLS